VQIDPPAQQWSDGPMTRRAAARGPARMSERSLAPDLARGSVLLFIALANVSTYFYGRPLGPGLRPVGGSVLDDVLDFVVTVLVDARSYPMFALLFGYGMVQLTGRQLSNGAAWPAVRRLLLRRQAGLLLLGAVHTFLLFHGDVLGVYAATGLVVLLLFRRSGKALLWWTTISVMLLTGLSGLISVVRPTPPAGTDGYLSQALTRLLDWGLASGLSAVLLVVVGPMLIGVLMARAQLLDRPGEHLVVLRRIAVGGVVTGVLGGIPFGLIVAGWGQAILPTWAAQALHGFTGVAAGAGYAALFALWAASRAAAERRGRVRVLAATGQRSLTGYLWQSVLFAPLLAPWGLGLGARLPTSLGYLLAVLVWASALLLAHWLDRAGRRGPAESRSGRDPVLPPRDGCFWDTSDGTCPTSTD